MKINDFQTKISIRTLIEIEDIDEDSVDMDEIQQNIIDFPGPHKIDPKKTIDF